MHAAKEEKVALAEKPKGVIVEIDNIGCVIDNLDKVITELQTRIADVMLQEIPLTSPEGRDTIGERCPMAIKINSLADVIYYLALRVKVCPDGLDI